MSKFCASWNKTTTYEGKLTRSVKKNEQKRMGFGGAMIICFFLMTFTLCNVFKPYIVGSLPLLDLEISMASRLKMIINTQETGQQPQSYTNLESATSTIQNMSNSRSQVYEMNGDVRIHGNSSTIFLSTTQLLNTTSWTINPYARHFDPSARKKVTDLSIITQHPNTVPPCTRSFDAPATVFSIGGYAGNPFHAFTDVLIPLYLTSQQFNRRVIFLVTDHKNPGWITKYKLILNMLSNYDVIQVGNRDEVLCFPRMIVGLKSHKEFGMDQSISPNYSMTNFTKSLRQAYALDRGLVGDCEEGRRPRLLIVSRKRTRRLTNEHEVAEMARSIGFEVSVREMGAEVVSAAKLVNGFDVMVAVHGAAISNMVFLPENGVVVQIVGCGMQSVSRNCFEIPARGMNLRYLEYRVRMKESSLVEEYGDDNEVCENPKSLKIAGWNEFRSVYLDNQDVSIDVVRFRETLLEAKKLVCS